MDPEQLRLLVFRFGWVGAALIGVGRTWFNDRLVRQAEQDRLAVTLNGILAERARWTKLDLHILGAALVLAAAAGIFSAWGIEYMWARVASLTCIVVEHLLLVWLTFNFAAGWAAVNHKILEQRLREKVAPRSEALPMSTSPVLKSEEG